ncbi:MAG: hypothetical protein OQJ76_03575 [Rhodospirillales bacterium]|nr:hypothetical protein [Rhodospirillales bacterium]
MAGLFRSPAPPAPPPLPVDNSAAEEARLRLENLRRRRRGRAATIATSERGLLAPGGDAPAPRRKSLLGE